MTNPAALLMVCWLGVALAQLSTTAQWPKAGYNDGHTAQSPYTLSSLGGGVFATVRYLTDGMVKSSPVITQDGNIVVASEDKFIYCLSNTGSKLWKYETNDSVWSIPAITQEGSIVVGINDGSILCLSSTGRMQWSYQTDDGVESSPAISRDGQIFVGSNDNHVYCLSSGTGSLIWKYQTGGIVSSSPAITQDGNIVVGNLDTNIYCLSSTGSLLWKFKTGKTLPSSPAIAQDGSIVMGSSDYYIYYLSSGGSLLWKYQTGGIVSSSPAISSEGNIIVGSYDKYLYSLSSSGSLQWRYKTGNWVTSSPAIAQDGAIVFGSDDTYVYCLSNAGSLYWKFQTADDVHSSPAIAQDGSVVIGGNDGYVYVLTGQPTASPTPLPSFTPQPSAPPTLLPTAAPFNPPPPLALFGDKDVLGASAAVAVLVALALFLMRDGAEYGSVSLVRHLPVFMGGSSGGCGGQGKDLTTFKPVEVLLPVILSVTATASNFVQIHEFLSSGTEQEVGIAAIMVLARMCTALHSAALLMLALSRKSWSKLLATAQLHKASLWVLVGVVMLTDTSHVRFFAWRCSDFAERSRGYPTLFIFKTCLFSSALSSLVQFSLSITHGVTFSSSISFALSLLSFLLAVTTAGIKLMAEKIHAHDETLLAEQGDLRAKVAVLEAKVSKLEAELAMVRGANDVPSPMMHLQEQQRGPAPRKSTRLSLSSLFGGGGGGRDDIPVAVTQTVGHDSEVAMTAFRNSESGPAHSVAP